MSLGNVFFINKSPGLIQVYQYVSLGITLFFLIIGLESLFLFTLGVSVSLFAIKATVFKYGSENLSEMNKTYRETMEHILSHCRLMNSTSVSPRSIIEEMTHSLKKCMKSDSAFFWLTDLNHKTSHFAATFDSADMEVELKRKWQTVKGKRNPFIDRLNGAPYGMKIIRTSDYVGIIGIGITSFRHTEDQFLRDSAFDFWSEMCEIMLERLHLDQVMDQMIVLEEQNRIANEIHDSVSQRLFGIVCSLYSLQVKGQRMTNDELTQEYQFLSQSANTTMKELRSSIFRLSATKRGEAPFFVRLKKYLDEYAKLNDIRIDYQITGDEALIPDKMKQALYRIICEACGNAVRHGACRQIELTLVFDFDKTTLHIKDDGIGYTKVIDQGRTEKGLGLYNIKSMVHSFAGTFTINGIQEVGTIMEIEIPNMNTLILEKVVGK